MGRSAKDEGLGPWIKKKGKRKYLWEHQIEQWKKFEREVEAAWSEWREANDAAELLAESWRHVNPIKVQIMCHKTGMSDEVAINVILSMKDNKSEEKIDFVAYTTRDLNAFEDIQSGEVLDAAAYVMRKYDGMPGLERATLRECIDRVLDRKTELIQSACAAVERRNLMSGISKKKTTETKKRKAL
jgi:hypothetical protein